MRAFVVEVAPGVFGVEAAGGRLVGTLGGQRLCVWSVELARAIADELEHGLPGSSDLCFYTLASAEIDVVRGIAPKDAREQISKALELDLGGLCEARVEDELVRAQLDAYWLASQATVPDVRERMRAHLCASLRDRVRLAAPPVVAVLWDAIHRPVLGVLPLLFGDGPLGTSLFREIVERRVLSRVRFGVAMREVDAAMAVRRVYPRYVELGGVGGLHAVPA